MRFGNLEEAVGAYQQGTQWAQQQQQQRQQQAALLALGKMLSQPNGQPQGQPQPTPAAPPAAAPQGQAPQGQAPQPPITLAPQTVAAMGGMSPQASAGLAALNRPSAAPQGAQPAQQPMQQPPVPGMSSTAQPDAAGMDDPIKAAQQSIMAIAQGIKAANPNIDPRTLALAVDQQIETIKGVSPLTKAAMTAQIQTVKLQQDWQYKQSRLAQIDQDVAVKVQNAKTAEERVQAYADGNQLRAQVMREGYAERLEGTRETNATRLTTAQIGASARKYAADKGYARGIDTANISQSGANARAGVGAEGKRGAAVTGAYTKAYSAFMANSPGATPEQAQAAAEAAADAVAAMMPATPARAANVPSGDPLAGQGRPAGRPVLTARPAPNRPGRQAPPAAAVASLKANPSLRKYFDEKYGAGAAAAALGK